MAESEHPRTKHQFFQQMSLVKAPVFAGPRHKGPSSTSLGNPQPFPLSTEEAELFFPLSVPTSKDSQSPQVSDLDPSPSSPRPINPHPSSHLQKQGLSPQATPRHRGPNPSLPPKTQGDIPLPPSSLRYRSSGSNPPPSDTGVQTPASSLRHRGLDSSPPHLDPGV